MTGFYMILILLTMWSDKERAVAFPLLFIGLVLAMHWGLM